MITLFLRLAVVVAAAVLLTALVTRLFLDGPADETALALVRGHAESFAEELAQTPPVSRRGLASSLSKRLGYNVSLEEASGSERTRAETRRGSLYVIARVPDNPGQVAFGPLPFRNQAGIAAIVVLAVLVASVLAAVLCLVVVRRIRGLEAVATRMERGDFSARATRDETDALDGIGASLNALADRVGQLLSDERDLLRTVAHEVRTPLSRMRFRAAGIAKASGEADKHISGLLRDLEQVDKLFEELLTYVAFDEFDQDRPELRMAAIDVQETVSRIADEFLEVDEGLTIEIVGDTSAKVTANQKLFDRATTNLLLNATVYGGPALRVEIREFENECVVDVQDSGPGIPELDRPKVVRPFVRLSKKKAKGTGLGLAIVSRIMRLHDGRLHIVDAPTGGASVQLVWMNAETRPSKRGFGLSSRARDKSAKSAQSGQT